MRALTAEVRDALWEAVKGHLPAPQIRTRRGRPRVADEVCFYGILIRLVTGSSWTTIEWLMTLMGHRVSDTTLRARRDEWIDADVFHNLSVEAVCAYDRIVGFDLERVVIDCSNHKAPCGGDDTGINPFDRGRLGFKWSIAVDTTGVPMVWNLAPANRNDYALLDPTLEQLSEAGFAAHIAELCLDRGYGYGDVHERVAKHGITNLDVIMRRRPGEGALTLVGLGHRWIVEAANAWLSTNGQLRRNTDRKPSSRNAAFAFAVTILITTRLIDWRNTWHQPHT